MKKKLIKSAILPLVWLLAVYARAGSVPEAGYNAISTLQSGESARALAMGSDYTAIAEGSASLYWNPAGLGRLGGTEISLHHGSGIGGSNRETVILGMKAWDSGGIAVSLGYLNNGIFEKRDEYGVLLPGENTAGEIEAIIGCGARLFPDLFAGAAIKAGQKSLAESSYYIFSYDLGLLWKAAPFFNVGVSCSNLGGKIRESPVMASVRAGISCELNPEKNNKVLLSAAFNAQTNGVYRLSAGVESTGYSILSVRLGYVYNLAETGLEGLTGLTAGLGIKAGDISVDYAFAPFGDLGSTHKVSLTYAITGLQPVKEEKKTYLPRTDSRVITFETVYFAHNSAVLSRDASELVKKNIKILLENPGTEIRITGHTSKSGSIFYNLQLSEKRAAAIRNYLIRDGGINPGRIFIVGYGDTHPAVFEAAPGEVNSDAARMNRRALFEIVKN